MIRMTVGAVWALRALTHTKTHSHQISCHHSLIWPHLSVKRHTRALRTHKVTACQHGHSLVWQREGQMALNHTSSSGHLIKDKFVCVVETPTDRPPNSSNTPPLRVNDVHSSHRLVQPMTKHDTYKQNTAPPTPPEWHLLCPLIVSSHLRHH